MGREERILSFDYSTNLRPLWYWPWVMVLFFIVVNSPPYYGNMVNLFEKWGKYELRSPPRMISKSILFFSNYFFRSINPFLRPSTCSLFLSTFEVRCTPKMIYLSTIITAIVPGKLNFVNINLIWASLSWQDFCFVKTYFLAMIRVSPEGSALR